mgnify:CR=1 FL=1
MKKKTIDYFNIGLGLNDQFFLLKEILKNKSFLRASHNNFLKKKVRLRGKTADLGSGKKNDYIKFILKDNFKIDNYDFYKKNNSTNSINLEMKFNLKKKKYKNILLFNVMEHVKNKNLLIKSISSSLSKNGNLEIFIPFLYRFHGDPNDYYRFTHKYLEDFLQKYKFKTKIYLISAGPFNVILEILFKYFKFKILRIIFSPFFILLNIIFSIISKDFKNYYCGVHCSCIKIK